MLNRKPDSESSDLRALFRAQVVDKGSCHAYVFLGSNLEPADVLTYEALGKSADVISSHLSAVARPGDRVLLAFNNDPAAVQLFWGCILAGLVPIPAPAPEAKNAKTGESRLQGIALDAGVSLALTHAEHLDAALAQTPGLAWHSLQTLLEIPTPALPVEKEGELQAPPHLAYLQYTSGSTSTPRGVEITHSAVLGQCRALRSCLETDQPRGLLWLPWFHDYGLVHGVIQSVYLGCTSYVMPTMSFVMRPLRWLEAIEKYGVTHTGAPDFAYAACVQALARTPGWSARLDTVQLATCGAEPVRAANLDAFIKAFEPFGFNKAALAPSYGLAEAVLAVTVHDPHTPLLQVAVDAHHIEHFEVRLVSPGTAGARTLMGCGTVLPGFELRIVDPDTAAPSAPDRVGEIWLRGSSIGRGYWGQPELSAEVFGATISGADADEMPYLRTGDLGFIHAGELFVAGRRKDLIIVNGRNLYPQDLERTAEAAHPGVRGGGVIAISVEKGGKESVALLVECGGRRPPDVVRQLIDQIHKQVANEHQLDLHDVLVLRTGTLPRTSSGKPQRSAARRLYLNGALEPLRLSAQATPASMANAPTELIEKLALLWSEILAVETIGPEANFFDLGGDSLMATQLVSRLRTRMGIELPISALFEAPTLHALALRVNEAPIACLESTAIPSPSLSTGTPRPEGSRVALSFSQERMWFMHELAPEGGAYNMPLALRLHGPLDVDAMQGAFARLIKRHEILRTGFVKTPQGVVGEVMPTAQPSLLEVHLGDDELPATEESLHRHLADVGRLPFQLSKAPLLRAQVVHLGQQNAVLLIVMHHIIGDQWSFAELGRELATHYNAIKAGTETALPALPFQYADHASWHRGWFAGERHARERAFWLQRLEGLEPLSLNEDFPRPRIPSYRGAAVRLPLATEEVAALRQLGSSHGASLSMVLIAALKVLLYRHTGRKDIAIGVPIANRHHLSSENLIGTFVNTLVYRTNLDGDPDFRTVLARVRDVSLRAFAHQDMPFELLVRELGGRPESGRTPLFNVMFNMVNAQARDCHFYGLTWSRLDFDRASTQFDLTVIADVLHDSAITIEYATDLFARETVERMGEHLSNILRAAVASPGVRVAALPLLGEPERATLCEWSMGMRDFAGASTVVDWVSQGARRAPKHLALVTDAERLTHEQLDRVSNQLARLLRQRGVSRGNRVGLCLPRGRDLVVALLAVLKTGAAYVPLDPDHPVQRLHHQVDDADLAVLITHEALANTLALEGHPCLLLDTDAGKITDASEEPLQVDAAQDAAPQDAAYVIYTSGSTGHPKGVVVPHRAVVNLLSSISRRPGFTPQDRLLAVTTPSFDISVLELLLPLGVGGAVVVASDSQATDGRALAELITRENITVMQATPSRWHLMLDAGWRGEKRLKALVGGEPLTTKLATQLLAACGEVWNMYGPTETTVWSSCWQVAFDALPAISLGQPVSNTSIQVLDDCLQPCPIGVPGEIYIGGAGVALGYHGRAELTAERFIEQPNADLREYRHIYRTGDLGRWRRDGSLEHLGRLDDQVKLRGFRIELGEIESQLLRHPGVVRAVVALREAPSEESELVAYLVPNGPMPSRNHLRQHLRRWLPDHMVPGLFVELASVPLLANGKTNRRALPAPTRQIQRLDIASEAPRNAVEATVWAAWQAVLHTDLFGIHDNFFDLGGHSILAIAVVSRIEAELKRPCALRLLFEHPTVADLTTALLQVEQEDAADTPISLLQPDGRGPALFLLAGAKMYRHLAQLLGPQLTVYGIFSQTEIDLLQYPAGVKPPAVYVEILAREYVKLIRSVQPHGPYLLGGFSIGGVLAYEVARQLRESGEEIRLIVLLDSVLPGLSYKHVLAELRRRLRMLRRQGLRHLLHLYQVYRKQAERRHEPGSQRIQIYTRAIRAYKAEPSDLPVLFLQAADDAATTPAYGWRSLVQGLTVERVPGRHMDMLEAPNVNVLASHILTRLTSIHPSPSVSVAASIDPPTLS